MLTQSRSDVTAADEDKEPPTEQLKGQRSTTTDYNGDDEKRPKSRKDLTQDVKDTKRTRGVTTLPTLTLFCENDNEDAVKVSCVQKHEST